MNPTVLGMEDVLIGNARSSEVLTWLPWYQMEYLFSCRIVNWKPEEWTNAAGISKWIEIRIKVGLIRTLLKLLKPKTKTETK